MTVQIVASLFIVYALFKVLSRYRDRSLSNWAALAWTLLWLAVGVVFWQPELASRLADWLGIGRGADVIIYGAIIGLVYINFRIYVKLDRQDRQLTKIVRQIAIDEEKGRRTDS